MRAITDPKKKKTKEKKPIVTSQDPDFPQSLLVGNEDLEPPYGFWELQKDDELRVLYESKRDEIEAYDRFLNDLEWLEKNGYFVPHSGFVNKQVFPINLSGEHGAGNWSL